MSDLVLIIYLNRFGLEFKEFKQLKFKNYLEGILLENKTNSQFNRSKKLNKIAQIEFRRILE